MAKQEPGQKIFFKPQEVVTDPPPNFAPPAPAQRVPIVATPDRATSESMRRGDPMSAWHTLHGIRAAPPPASSAWAQAQHEAYGANPYGTMQGSWMHGGGGGAVPMSPQADASRMFGMGGPPPYLQRYAPGNPVHAPHADTPSAQWGDSAAVDALYHTKVAETLHHVELAKRHRARMVAARDALAVQRQRVIDTRARAIAGLQEQFTELQNQLLTELRRAVGAVEAAEHGVVRPIEAQMDGLAQRVHDIDRLAELTTLKIQSEPKHRFVEYARLLRQDLAAATAVPVPDAAMLPVQTASADGDGAAVVMPEPPIVSVVVHAERPATRNAKIQTNMEDAGTTVRSLCCALLTLIPRSPHLKTQPVHVWRKPPVQTK